ncbi:MAG: DNA polymerase III subunit beta family protein, partial [Planctomycetota bacterium]
EIGLSNLQAGIEQCLFATAKESSRYAINGVLWQIKGKNLMMVATDGRRLAWRRVKLASAPKGEVPSNLIVPGKAMGLLDKVGGSEKDAVA